MKSPLLRFPVLSLLTVGILLTGCEQAAETPSPAKPEASVSAPAEKAAPGYVVPSGPAQDVTILAWNLEHFVDPYDDPYITNDYDDQMKVKSDIVLQKIAYCISTLDPDILVLTEVEGDQAVKLFLNSFLPNHQYKYSAAVPATDWYQNVSIHSKLPLGRIISLREQEMTSPTQNRTRNDVNARLMAAEVLGPGTNRFIVAGLHLKAGREDENVEWRTLQSALVQDLLAHEDRALPGVPIIVAGDMNMLPDSIEFVALTQGGPIKLGSPFAEWGYPATHASDDPQRTFDYIFHNETMAKFYVPDSGLVPTPLSLADMRSISDHLPVIATYSMPQ